MGYRKMDSNTSHILEKYNVQEGDAMRNRVAARHLIDLATREIEVPIFVVNTLGWKVGDIYFQHWQSVNVLSWKPEDAEEIAWGLGETRKSDVLHSFSIYEKGVEWSPAHSLALYREMEKDNELQAGDFYGVVVLGPNARGIHQLITRSLRIVK